MKTYKLTFIKTGKEWKELTTGLENLPFEMEDDKHYKLTWELKGFWNAIRGWWGIKIKNQHSFHY